MIVIVFFVIFLSLFGPKLAGTIDLSVIGGLLGSFILLFIKHIKVSKEYIFIVLLLTTVTLYSALIVIVNNTGEYQPFLRNFRALVSCILLGLVFYNLSINGVLSSARLANTLTVVLLINAIVIIASIVIPDIKILLADLYNFNKKFVNLRSFGLTAGYDTAGYLCVIGAILSALNAYYTRKARYSILILIFITATIFTSRSSMLLMLVVMLAVCVLFLLKGRLYLKLMSLAYIIFGSSVAIHYVAPLIISTFLSQEPNTEYTSNYAATDLLNWYESMWILPEDLISILFGAGKAVEISDLGYVSLIFMIGLLGLLFIVFIYAYMFFVIYKLNRSIKHYMLQQDAGLQILILLFMSIIVIVLFINTKNLYFLTRGYHELIMIIFFFILGSSIREISKRRKIIQYNKEHHLAASVF